MSLPIPTAQGLAQTLGEVGTSSEDASLPAGATFQPQPSILAAGFISALQIFYASQQPA